MMKSLRARLLLILLVTISLVWGAWLTWQTMQMSREQTGWSDSSLRSIAQQILLSLPSDVEALSGGGTLALPADVSFTGDKMSWQVWVANRSILRSPGAPPVPLRPDFRDGFADRQIEDQEWRVYAISDSTGHIQVQVGKTQRQLRAELLKWLHGSIVSAGLLSSIMGVGIWLVIGWSLRPVTAVQTAIKDRKPLDLEPLPTKGLPVEVLPLVDSFNRLLQRLDLALQGERRFIADAAHELRTPLAALLAYAQVALRAESPQQTRAALLRLASGVERSARLSEQLLDLARLDASKHANGHQLVDLAELVVVIVSDYEVVATDKRQRISLDTEPCSIVGQTDELGILLRNLIDNALRYTPEGGHVAVCCRRRAENGERGISLTIADDGPGVPGDERERIFDRFYRVAGNGQRGSGIGLSLVARIAELHRATIEVGDGLDGRGLGVTVRFPDPTELAARPMRHAPESLSPGFARARTPVRPAAQQSGGAMASRSP